MYRDVSENKPPLGYWLYTLAVAIGGANELTIRLMPIPYVLATIALVWWLGLRLRGPGAGLPGGLPLRAPEHRPVPVWATGRTWSTSSTCSPSPRWRRWSGRSRQPGSSLAGAGRGWSALASLVKQVAALHGPIYALALILVDRIRRDGASLANRLGSKVAGPARPGGRVRGDLGVWRSACSGSRGRGRSAFDDIVTYGSALATIKVPDAARALASWSAGSPATPTPTGAPAAVRPDDYLVWWGTGSWPLWLAAVPSTAWLLVGRGRVGHGRLVGRPGRSRAGSRSRSPACSGSTITCCRRPAWPWSWPSPWPMPSGLVGPSLRPFRVGRSWSARSSALGLLASDRLDRRLQVRDYLLVAPEDLTSRFKGGCQWVVLRAMGRELARRSEAWDRPSAVRLGLAEPALASTRGSTARPGTSSPTRSSKIIPRGSTATTPGPPQGRADHPRPGGPPAVDGRGGLSRRSPSCRGSWIPGRS